MEIELTVAGGTGLAISANTFPVCSDDARQTTMDGAATAAARATGSTLSDDVAPAKAGATERFALELRTMLHFRSRRRPDGRTRAQARRTPPGRQKPICHQMVELR